jgi:hypothetical protein
MSKNLSSSLCRKKKHRDPMRCYDELPCELRQWLSAALLPWSPRSALKAYQKALRTKGSLEGALAELDKKQIRLLEKDCAIIWGEQYPKLSHYTH